MYAPRRISVIDGHRDADGVKLYGISATPAAVEAARFLAELARLKAGLDIRWPQTAAFAILHEGAQLPYLVLCWWDNDNEMFVRVAVREAGGWIVDPEKYSFCVWDMEVMWRERQSYIRWVYSERPDLDAYRADLMPPEPLAAVP